MTDSLCGRLLVASPALVDPNFRRSVVLVVAHDDDGTVDVFSGGRKMRVALHPEIETDELLRGQEVVLNESLNVVLARSPEVSGEVVTLKEILEEQAEAPTREEVVAELVLFMRETVRELGERRAGGFLKKFYGWYLGRGRFPRPFKQELVQLATTEEVERRLLAAAPGAADLLERLEAELPTGDEVLLDMPISVYGGG